MNETQIQFDKILEEAKNDPNIIGFWLGGSMGKGMVTEYSDYDCCVIVKDEVFDEYTKRYSGLENTDFGFVVKTLQMFVGYADLGSKSAWDRYNFTHIKPLVDKTGGKIEKLIEEKGIIPPDNIRDFVSGNLDGYINQVYRSLKCYRDGNKLASRLEAVEEISFLLNAIFGLEGRIKPYYKYIQWELKNYPLMKLPWDSMVFLDKIANFISNPEIVLQQELLKMIELTFRSGGYGDIFDSWKDKLDWMKSYKG